MLKELKGYVLEYFDWEFKERRRGQHFLGRIRSRRRADIK